MLRRTSSKGFTAVEVLLVILVVAVLAFGGWYVWHKTRKTTPATKSNSQTSQQTTTQQSSQNSQTSTDPTDGGKYLVITEWGARVALPADLQGKVAYTLDAESADPDGNLLQSAKILIKSNPADGGDTCAIVKADGSYIQSGTQYIRSQASKPFNASRYRTTLKANILSDGTHAYHLNYLTPDCAGPSATTQIEELQTALVSLEKVK